MKEQLLKDGTRKVEVRLKQGEHLLIVKDDAYYQLGNQMEDVVYAGTLVDSFEVYWSQYEQKWKPE